ncbi:MAG: hypothetical protein RIS35_3296 [Pseudomonadota bacterium]
MAIVRARYNPFGGAERFVQRALGALAAQNLRVTVIARDWTPGDTDGLPVRLEFLKVDPFHVGRLWRDWSFARGVRRLIASHRFAVVQSHERIPGVALYRAGDGVHAVFLEQRRRVLPRWRGALLRLNPFHAYVLRSERRMFTDPALRAVICNSEMVRREIRSRFGVAVENLPLIRNGVDASRFRPATVAERAASRRQFGLPDGAPVFAFVGSGFERKGLEATLRAFARVAGELGASLLVAGTDRRAARYRSLARRLGVEGAVRFLGGVEDVRPVLHAADAFVLPTLYDPFPNAVLEALAVGLPVITSTGCGAAEVISPGVNGFVVDALEVDAIADAMRRLADRRGRADRAAAARRSVAGLTLDAMAEQLSRLYRELLTRSSAGIDSRGASDDRLNCQAP